MNTIARRPLEGTIENEPSAEERIALALCAQRAIAESMVAPAIEISEQQIRQELRAILDRNARTATEITNTLLWFYRTVERPSVPYAKTSRELDVLRLALLQSQNWYDHKTISTIPLVQTFERGDDVLLLGTNSECREMYEKLGDLSEGTRLRYCSVAGSFWKAFFGEEQFLDVDPSRLVLPRLMAATGLMRGYDGSGAGLTLAVHDQLTRISEHYNVPLIFLTDLERTTLSFQKA